MSADEPAPMRDLSPEVITQAAAWVARLHGPLRSAAAEEGFRTWLQERPEHGRALELVTESWEELEALKGAVHVQVSAASDRCPRQSWLRYGLAATVAIALLFGIYLYSRPVRFSTAIGEQRAIVLADGTRVTLNTSSRIVVDFDKKERHVSLTRGEAFFEVAKNATWPFVVTAGDRNVTAVGTAFLVRRDQQAVAVTLMEGRVIVTSDHTRQVLGAADTPVQRTALEPGERVTFTPSADRPQVDRPVVETLTAWERGKVSIDNLSLADAIAEMNRYSVLPLVLDTAEAAPVRVSGIFRAGDSLSFAKAVAQHYGLEVQQQSGRIVLRGLPTAPSADTGR